jgi:hypothetical protein
MPFSSSSSHSPTWSSTYGAHDRPGFVRHAFVLVAFVLITAIAMWYSIGATILHSSQDFFHSSNNNQRNKLPEQQQLQQVPSFVPQSALVSVPSLNISLAARPAAFGPKISGHLDNDEDGPFGFEGQLEVAIDSFGCAGYSKSRDYSGKIVLVERGECSFYDKIYNLQTQHAAAVVVGDNVYRRGLITMYTELEDNVVIPSVFVSKESYNILRKLHGRDQHIIVTVADIESSVIGTIIFLMLSPLCSLSMIYCFLLLHRRYKKMQERASKKAVSKLPVRTWHRPNPETHRHNSAEAVAAAAPDLDAENSEGSSSQEPILAESSERNTSSSDEDREKVWTSSAECIICMDDYVDGVSQVMRLPCHHEFHVECITRWLTTRKKTCPICKYDVTLGKRVPELASTSGDARGGENDSELTPSEELLVSDGFESSSEASSGETTRLLDDAQTRV